MVRACARGHEALAAGGYVDQSASDLRLRLFAGDFDASQFRLLESATLAGSRLTLQAHIIGASHLLQFSLPDGPRFHELLACGDVTSPRPPLRCIEASTRGDWLDQRLFEHGCEGEGSSPHRSLSRVGYRYRGELCSEGSGGERLAELADRIACVAESSAGCERGLEFQFPRGVSEWSMPPSQAPRTLIWLRLDAAGEAVEVETAHSYPAERQILFSQSRIVCGRGALAGGELGEERKQ